MKHTTKNGVALLAGGLAVGSFVNHGEWDSANVVTPPGQAEAASRTQVHPPVFSMTGDEHEHEDEDESPLAKMIDSGQPLAATVARARADRLFIPRLPAACRRLPHDNWPIGPARRRVTSLRGARYRRRRSCAHGDAGLGEPIGCRCDTLGQRRSSAVTQYRWWSVRSTPEFIAGIGVCARSANRLVPDDVACRESG